MMQKDLLQSLVYLDKDYIADSYEAWSGESAEASIIPTPLVSTITRGPARPRITGRLAPGPKKVERTPGKPDRTSPKPAAGAVSRSSRRKTSTLVVEESIETT